MKKTLSFLRKIKKNNNSEWMKTHREEYLEARKEFEFLVQELIFRISEWDDRFSSLEPKDCIFRFNRDVRFSDNKSPYKENFAAFFGIGGKKSELPGYYISISPKEIFAGGGLWHPQADKLIKLRRSISLKGDELTRIVQNKKFVSALGGLSEEDTLKRVPRGFESDHQYGHFLKLKSFIAAQTFPTTAAVEKDFGKKIDKVFREIKPLNGFLHRAITESHL